MVAASFSGRRLDDGPRSSSGGPAVPAEPAVSQPPAGVGGLDEPPIQRGMGLARKRSQAGTGDALGTVLVGDVDRSTAAAINSIAFHPATAIVKSLRGPRTPPRPSKPDAKTELAAVRR